MRTHAVLFASGRDRVGAANDLAAALANRSIDIENSRMTALGGQFSMLVQVAGEERDVSMLRQDLDRLGTTLGFHLRVETLERRPSPVRSLPRYEIEAFSPGPSGIHDLTGVLRMHDVNIEDLHTDSASHSFSPEVTFHMTARITLPPTCNVQKLRRELRTVEQERDLDIAVKPIPAGSERPMPTTLE